MNILYTIIGIVEHGKKRGKKLGYPTANIPLKEKLEEGVYISQTIFNKKKYNSLTFIGIAKTFTDATEYLSETFLFDFNQDIYGKNVIVTILKKIRGNMQFSTVDDLIEQMKKDEKDAEKFFIDY